MKIAVATSGRFHVLDLAREFKRLGHEVQFHTLLPARRAQQFGLSHACVRSWFLGALPWLAAARIALRKDWSRTIRNRLTLRLDHLVAQALKPCEVFIGMSGLFVKAGHTARHRFGALWVLERGSRHILSQKEILDALPGPEVQRVSDFDVRREMEGYEGADVIAVPSRHAEESFRERGVPSEKLFRNPYGVDIRHFQPTVSPEGEITILFAGAWSYRKGADLLAAAVSQMRGVRLHHVGAIEDAPLPKTEWFASLGPLEQLRLAETMMRSHVFALASREDGFGMVLIQALACGLPVACTDKTGGPDLAETIPDASFVSVARAGQVASFRQALEAAIRKAVMLRGTMRDGLGVARSRWSWPAYAERYDRFLRKRVGKGCP